MPAGVAKPVDGGFRISGRWKYASGCEHCEWAFLGGTVEGKPDDRRIFVIPHSDYEIVDTWHVPGLKGTGSHDIVVEDAFVPEYRTQKYSDNFRGYGPGLALNTSPLYRLPFGQVFFRGVSTGAIGALQGMLDAYLDYGKKRIRAPPGTPASEDAVIQLLCAEVAVAIDEMKTILHRNFKALEDYAARGEMPPLQAARRIQIPQRRGGGAVQPAGGAAVQGRRHRGHRRRSAVRPDPVRHHRRPSAHLQSVRAGRQELRRHAVRHREQQGLRAVTGIPTPGRFALS